MLREWMCWESEYAERVNMLREWICWESEYDERVNMLRDCICWESEYAERLYLLIYALRALTFTPQVNFFNPYITLSMQNDNNSSACCFTDRLYKNMYLWLLIYLYFFLRGQPLQIFTFFINLQHATKFVHKKRLFYMLTSLTFNFKL